MGIPSIKSKARTVLAIDPGTRESAYVVYAPDERRPICHGIEDNAFLCELVRSNGVYAAHMAIEQVASYGMAVGRDVFETVWWAGRLCQAWHGCDKHARRFTRIERRDIKLHLCGSSRAKDPNVRQALIDKFPATGGGRLPQVGTKAKPGPLYGVKSHIWAALAVAVTWAETVQVVEGGQADGE